MKIIGFAGVARAGKTTAANVYMEVAEQLGVDNCVVLSFAEPLREALRALGVYKSDHPALYRDLAQTVGSSLRIQDPNHFVWMMRQVLDYYDNEGYDFVFIDDVRYENEIAMIERSGGEVRYIDARERIDTTQPMYGHESEYLAKYWTGNKWATNNGSELCFKKLIQLRAEKELGQEKPTAPEWFQDLAEDVAEKVDKGTFDIKHADTLWRELSERHPELGIGAMMHAPEGGPTDDR